MVNIVGIIHDKSIVRSRVANRIALYRFHCNNLRRQSKSHAITHGTRSQMTREAEEEGIRDRRVDSKCELRHCHEADTSGYRGLGLAINNLSPNEEETKRWSTERGVRHVVAGEEEDTVRNANARATSVHQHHHLTT